MDAHAENNHSQKSRSSPANLLRPTDTHRPGHRLHGVQEFPDAAWRGRHRGGMNNVPGALSPVTGRSRAHPHLRRGAHRNPRQETVRLDRRLSEQAPARVPRISRHIASRHRVLTGETPLYLERRRFSRQWNFRWSGLKTGTPGGSSPLALHERIGPESARLPDLCAIFGGVIYLVGIVCPIFRACPRRLCFSRSGGLTWTDVNS